MATPDEISQSFVQRLTAQLGQSQAQATWLQTQLDAALAELQGYRQQAAATEPVKPPETA